MWLEPKSHMYAIYKANDSTLPTKLSIHASFRGNKKAQMTDLITTSNKTMKWQLVIRYFCLISGVRILNTVCYQVTKKSINLFDFEGRFGQEVLAASLCNRTMSWGTLFGVYKYPCPNIQRRLSVNSKFSKMPKLPTPLTTRQSDWQNGNRQILLHVSVGPTWQPPDTLARIRTAAAFVSFLSLLASLGNCWLGQANRNLCRLIGLV